MKGSEEVGFLLGGSGLGGTEPDGPWQLLLAEEGVRRRYYKPWEHSGVQEGDYALSEGVWGEYPTRPLPMDLAVVALLEEHLVELLV